MEFFADGLGEALRLLWSRDPLVLAAAFRTLWVSGLAVGIATLAGVPLGTWLARTSFGGRRLLVVLFRGGMAVPTVFIGLVCFALFARRGPLGPLELLYTPWAIAIGELMLAFPIVVSISHGAVSALDVRVAETMDTLGASLLQRATTFVSEARVGITLAVLTALARCMTELGVAMMAGGNIKHRTRTLSTAIALETSRGEFAAGLAMGIILLAMALGTIAIIGALGREKP